MQNRMMSALLLAVCVPTLALAQQERGAGTWELSAGGGVKVLDRAFRDFITSGQAANRFSTSGEPSPLVPGVAMRLGYNYSRHWGFSIGGEVASGADVTYMTPLAAITYSPHFDAKTSPFVTVGTQVTRVMGENERRTHPTWGAHVGLGIRQMFSDQWAFRIEGRVATEHFAELPGKKADYPGMGTIGLSYFMRGPRRPTVIASSGGEVFPIVRYKLDTAFITRVDTVRSYVHDPSLDQLILRVQFKTDAAELLPISRPLLDTIAQAIVETPGSRWEVQGHTDNVGTPADNKVLAQARAQTVVDYLVSQGVDRGILTAAGFGEARPVFSNKTAYGRAQNRRVQLRRIPPPPTGVPVP